MYTVFIVCASSHTLNLSQVLFMTAVGLRTNGNLIFHCSELFASKS